MDSQLLDQVGVVLKHPPVSPLSLWERARVRATVPDQTQINAPPTNLGVYSPRPFSRMRAGEIQWIQHY
jgi:hypothetical protein